MYGSSTPQSESTGAPITYDNSNVITDFRLVLYDTQPPDELHESVPQGLTCRFHKCGELLELTSGVNYEKKKKTEVGTVRAGFNQRQAKDKWNLPER